MPQYQGVWTLEQQAQALTNQQWVTDPNFKNTTLLLQADGTGSGSQNQTFLDGSTNNFFITRNGNTTQGSFSPFSQAPGYWGNYFAGTSDYLTTPTNAAFTFGTGDFTVEFWCYPIGYTGGNDYIYFYAQGASAGSTASLGIFLQGGLFKVWNGSTVITGTVPRAYNNWYHVAVSRSGTSMKLFINGIQDGSTATNSNNITTGSTTGASLGRWSEISDVQYYIGYLSNVRALKGTALYTANFTPQTSPLTNITNTSILTCQSNRFVDNSTNAFAITANGTPSVQGFSPFAPALQWTPDVVGGSGYFDGTTDSLTTPSSANLAIGTSDFCIEWFYYQTSTQTSATPLCQWGGSTLNWILQFNSGSFIFYYNSGSSSISYSYTPVPNQWLHGCVCRSGSTMSLYLNGVRVNTKTDAFSIANTTGITVGRNPDGAGQDCTGYISSARLVVGSSVYTPSSTTLTVPTAPLTAVTGTQFLMSATNAGIYDGKMANNLETVGNAQVATSPVKYGSGSMYFNGSTSYLTRPYSPLFALGNGNFTVECWINTFQNGGANYPSVVGRWAAGASWDLRHSAGDNSGKPTFAYNDGTSNFNVLSTGSTVYDGQWHHLAAVRNNNIITLYVDGVSVGTSTFTGTIAAATSTPLTVGSTSGGGVYYTGYIDDLRITVGVARYFTTFTPPQQALPRQ